MRLRHTLLVMALLLLPARAQAQSVFVNEIHYDNAGTDTEEGVEIAGPSGTSLSGYVVYFYNGAGGTFYGSHALSGTIPSVPGSGHGAVWVPFSGIQNGDPDGIVLYHTPSSTVVQALAWEGSFTATAGPASGTLLPDIGVAQTTTTPGGLTLQLTGTGTVLTDFTWSGPAAHSRGAINAGQTFSSVPAVTTQLVLTPQQLTEGQTASATLTLTPPPAAPVVVNLSASPAGQAGFPSTVTVPPSGTATFSVTAAADQTADGYQAVTLSAAPPAPWPGGAGELGIIDADRAPRLPGALRIATFNVAFGIGAPGSASFNAVRECLERIDADVIAFQEVDHAGEFSELATLLGQMGIPADRAHLGTKGDAFVNDPWSGGDYTTTQNVAIASRYPITRTVQIGRGVPGRKELARFPVLAAIDHPDIPGTADLTFISVHLKAGTTQADSFRRAVEARRVTDQIRADGLDVPGSRVFVLGDFNASDFGSQPASFGTAVSGGFTFGDGSSLPVSWQMGQDLVSAGSIAYATFPHRAFDGLPLRAADTLRADGLSESTFAYANYHIDYLFCPVDLVTGGQVFGEAWTSRMDHAFDGLPKRQSIATPALTETATDHLLVWADVFLQPHPSLSLTPSAEWLPESTRTFTATLSLPSPAPQPVTVNLEAWRDDRISPERSQVTLPAGSTGTTVTFHVADAPGIQPHRTVTLIATATGYTPAKARLRLVQEDAAGHVLITQYVEPVGGTAPHALELLNLTGADIDLRATPLQILRYTNGASESSLDGYAEFGTLPAGGVLVFGEASVGDWLVAQGLLPAPATPFATADEHTVFSNAAGHAVYVKETLNFNGDDALEILLDYTRADIFGLIGQDPGTAWTGGGISTSESSLTIRPAISTGSAGWTDPSRRFAATPGADPLAGLGTVLPFTDPWRAWIAAHSLTGIPAAPSSDPDGDGVPNLIEYAALSAPVDAASRPATSLEWSGSRLILTFPARTNDPLLTLSAQQSTDLSSWSAATTDSVVSGVHRFSAAGGARRYLRVQVSRP